MKFAKGMRSHFSYPIRLMWLAGLAGCAIIIYSCGEKQTPLPIFGEREVRNGDTVYHRIAPFRFIDQDSSVITNEAVRGKIYVADFFFTTCRTICPIMKTQMLRVHDAMKNDDDVLIMSHTIDPEYDTVALLRDFAERLGVESSKWHFLTGEKDS